jgi:hypothetical protein
LRLAAYCIIILLIPLLGRKEGYSAVSKRTRPKAKTGSKSEARRSIPTPQSTLFNQRLLLEGEDAAAYDQLVASVRAALNPVDIIDEIYIADAVILEWDVLRYHRLKLRLISAAALSALEHFLVERVHYFECFAQNLADRLEEGLPEDEKESAETLAKKYTDGDLETIKKVTLICAEMGVEVADVQNDAQIDSAKEPMQAYLRREPDSIREVDEFHRGGREHGLILGRCIRPQTRRC